MFKLDYKLILLSYIFVALVQSATTNDNNNIIKPPCGPIRGSSMSTLTGKNFYAFRGIPYGEAPVGNLRFQRPETKRPWIEILDATKEGPECIQYDLLRLKIIGQEDCLHLNVYAQELTTENKPVLVYIHGGGFGAGSGSSEFYGPKRILDHNVILITINYRIHVLGFLSTLDSASPGNYGLLDQIEALKWVQTNIKSFGGDPKNVTIMGESAGAASVLYQMISPLSKGLFQRIIAMSGTPLAPWASTDTDYWTKKFLTDVGCRNKTNIETIQCLRSLSAQKLVEPLRKYFLKTIAVFRPVVDNYFLQDNAGNLLREKKIANHVPVLMGVTKDEALLMYTFNFLFSKPKYSDKFKKSIVTLALAKPSDELPENVVDLIDTEYYSKINITDDKALRDVSIKLLSDSLFFAPHHQTNIYLLNSGLQPYVYSYDYETNHTVMKLFFMKPSGVSHADDLFFLFDSKLLFPQDYTIPNDENENKFLNMWINFAKSGNPNPEISDGMSKWMPATQNKIQIYHLDNPTRLEEYKPENDTRLDFWMEKIPNAMDSSTAIRQSTMEMKIIFLFSLIAKITSIVIF